MFLYYFIFRLVLYDFLCCTDHSILFLWYEGDIWIRTFMAIVAKVNTRHILPHFLFFILNLK